MKQEFSNPEHNPKHEFSELNLPDLEDLKESRPSNDLPLGEGVHTFNDDCIIGEIEINGEKRRVKAIHNYEGSIHLGEHPASQYQEETLGKIAVIEATGNQAYDLLDNLPDHNEEYQENIEQAYEITGLSDRNIKILDEERTLDYWVKGRQEDSLEAMFL